MSNLKLGRVIAAFIVAPLVVPIIFYLVFTGDTLHQNLTGIFSTILFYGPYAYAVALIVGLPLFVIAVKNNLLKWYFFLASGFLVGAGVGLLLSSLTVDPLKLIMLCGVSGLLTSMVFWLIMKPESAHINQT